MRIAMKVLSRRSRTKIDIIKIKMRTRELTPTTTAAASHYNFAALISHLQLQSAARVRWYIWCSALNLLHFPFSFITIRVVLVSAISSLPIFYISPNFRQINGSEHTSCSFALDNAMRRRMITTIMSLVLVVSSLFYIAIDVCCSETAACSQSPCDIPAKKSV